MIMNTISKHQTRTEFVTEHLKGQILNGAIKGGEALRQNTIAQALGVSHIPVREALLRLAEQGLVKIVPHKGAVVLELSSREIDEVSDLRVLIECHALRRAIPHLTKSDFDKAEIALLRYEEVVTKRQDMELWGDLNFEFHSIIYRGADYPGTMRIIRDLHRQSDRYIRVLLFVTGWRGQAHEEHRKLLDLTRAGEIEAASRICEQHIRSASHAISEHLQTLEQATQQSA
ncbi:MAG: GntR family transcriptional regulator [Wenzhouxiangellaceae bacterium]